MRESTAHGGRVPVIAIVGGGASGTLTAVHLLRRIQPQGTPLRLVLIDRYGRHGLGQAYATTDPHHLLNTCVTKMSAVDDDPDHLLRWARSEGLNVAGSDFLPRNLYGRYLRAALATAAGRAWPTGRLTQVTGTAVSLTRAGLSHPLRIHLSNGGRIDADAVVLATGNRAPAARAQIASSTRYIADPWAPSALAEIRDGSPVLVVGTGLTMIDVALTLTRAHPQTVVYALSRHGLLPLRHRCPSMPPAEISLPDGVLRLPELLRAVRVAVNGSGGEWHGVIDALRPQIPRLWAQLSIEDQRRFLASVARYWEIHRHRIPPATAARIDSLRAAGRLHVLRGHLTSAVAGHDQMVVHLETEGSMRELHVGWLVNGTGPPQQVTPDPFLGSLFASGLARTDPLRLGLDADDSGAIVNAAGHVHDNIFTLGPTLRGLRYETTAIPEIRAQAAALASRLITATTSEDRPPHTAPALETEAREHAVAT